MQQVEIWKFLAGLGFFLYGMNLMEKVLKEVSGRPLKLFLKRNTKSVFKSILGGALITGLIQSSSVVTLLVLAFVESGVISFRNALGVILGANLGTTLDSWVVATVGFKFDVMSYSLPVIAICSLLMYFFERRKNLFNLLYFFLALGILFLGLGFMKESAKVLVLEFELAAYASYGTLVFVLIGFLLTAIIQSSSATTAIALTAIHSGAIDLRLAAAVIIGAEVGTTIKILLLGMKGSADKKRISWADFLFNLFTAAVAYAALGIMIYAIENVIGIHNPLIGLVFFQTSINVISILLVLPFLGRIASWFEKRFRSDEISENSYIRSNLPTEPALVPDALAGEAEHLLKKTLKFNTLVLSSSDGKKTGFIGKLKSLTSAPVDMEEQYLRLKQTEGDILSYYADMHKSAFKREESAAMIRYIHAARQAIYSTKAVKDIIHNMEEFDASVNDYVFKQCKILKKDWKDFEKKYKELLKEKNLKALDKQLQVLLKEAFDTEAEHKNEAEDYLRERKLSALEAPTLMNVFREMLSCKKSLIKALRNLRFEEENGREIM